MAQNKEEEVRRVFRELGHLLKCNDFCKKGCVFSEIGKGAGCPLNQFEDMVLEAIGIRVD